MLAVELLGASAMLPYAMLLPWHTVSTGSSGLPPDNGRLSLPQDKHFKVHVLVPCYKVGRVLCAGGYQQNDRASLEQRLRDETTSSVAHSPATHNPALQEGVATVKATLEGVLSAHLPPGCTRTVYLW